MGPLTVMMDGIGREHASTCPIHGVSAVVARHDLRKARRCMDPSSCMMRQGAEHAVRGRRPDTTHIPRDAMADNTPATQTPVSSCACSTLIERRPSVALTRAGRSGSPRTDSTIRRYSRAHGSQSDLPTRHDTPSWVNIRWAVGGLPASAARSTPQSDIRPTTTGRVVAGRITAQSSELESW